MLKVGNSAPVVPYPGEPYEPQPLRGGRRSKR